MQRRAVLAIVVAAVATLAGCAPGSSGSGGRAEGVDAVVVMDEWSFVPDRLELDGATAVVEFRNEGAIAHEWSLLREPIVRETDYDEETVVAGVLVPAGERRVVTISLPPPGDYQFVCPIPGHFPSGMAGRLDVGG